MTALSSASIFNARRMAPGALFNPVRAAAILAVAPLESVR
jgi:hypothetical protein